MKKICNIKKHFEQDRLKKKSFMMHIFYYFEISVSLCFSSRKKLNDKIVNLLQQKSLIDDGVCAPPRAQQVVDQHMLPLVGERQRVFENNLETMEVCPFFGPP